MEVFSDESSILSASTTKTKEDRLVFLLFYTENHAIVSWSFFAKSQEKPNSEEQYEFRFTEMTGMFVDIMDQMEDYFNK